MINTVDPLGGAYHVEALTNRLEREAYDYFHQIDELGGMVAAIEENMPQREIAEAAYRYQQEVEANERISSASTGTRPRTTRTSTSSGSTPTSSASRSSGSGRSRRGATGCRRAAARGIVGGGLSPDRNLMPFIVDAVRDGVTLGEICDAWRSVWGTWREQPVF